VAQTSRLDVNDDLILPCGGFRYFVEREGLAIVYELPCFHEGVPYFCE